MTALIFIAVLFVLILVHEWGHYITAKKTGMRVDEFGIGFPPKLFGYKKNETEYTFNALPIGGFVRIYGEDPTQVEKDADSERAFSARPRIFQAIVLLAGVTMNILLAWVLFVAIFMMGVPTAVSEDAASSGARMQVVQAVPESPLQDKLPIGATIESVETDEATLETLYPSDFGEFIAAAGDSPVTIGYSLGDDEPQYVTVTPSSGVLQDKPEQRAVGIQTVLVEDTEYSFFAALKQASIQTYDALQLIVVSIASLLYNTVSGSADFSQVAGPIGIYNLVGDAASIGLVSLLMFTAIISLNLAVINLFPFPALDGGRLLFVAIESIIRRPIDPIWTSRLNLLGFIILIALMVAVTYNDILRL